MANGFHAFKRFFAQQPRRFLGFNSPVSAAAEDNSDVLVFDACSVQFSEHWQEHSVAGHASGEVVHYDGDFMLWLGDFA